VAFLTIETSTPFEHVAIVEEAGVVAERALEGGRSRSDELLAAVDDVLRGAGLTVRELEGIVVSAGPGRFTGLRVGIATAKGLSAASGLPVFAASTLAALALAAGPTEDLVCPVLDARRGEVYGAVFEGEEARRLTDDAALPPSDFGDLIRGIGGDRTALLLGTGATACRSELAEALGGNGRFADPEIPIPTPSALVAAADRSRPVDPASFEPTYIRGVVPSGPGKVGG